MARPLSMLLNNLIADAEMGSSFYGALDKQRTYDGLTAEEHTLCTKALRSIFKKFDMEHPTFTARKEAVKQFVKEARKNESMPAR